MQIIDERVKWRGVSKIRQLNADALRALGDAGEIIVFHTSYEPRMVLIPYEMYQQMTRDLSIGLSMEPAVTTSASEA